MFSTANEIAITLFLAGFEYTISALAFLTIHLVDLQIGWFGYCICRVAMMIWHLLYKQNHRSECSTSN